MVLSCDQISDSVRRSLPLIAATSRVTRERMASASAPASPHAESAAAIAKRSRQNAAVIERERRARGGAGGSRRGAISGRYSSPRSGRSHWPAPPVSVPPVPPRHAARGARRIDDDLRPGQRRGKVGLPERRMIFTYFDERLNAFPF